MKKAILLLTGLLIITLIGIYVTLPSNNNDVITLENEIKTLTNTQGITYEGTELVDHRYKITPEECLGGNLGMNISIRPCVANSFSGEDINHEISFTWNGAQAQNTSWVFVYEGELEDNTLRLGTPTNKEYVTSTIVETYVEDYTVSNVISYTDISPPTTEICDLGNDNNTFAYNVTQNNGNTTSTVYCFSEFTSINPSTFLISGNANTRNNTLVTEEVISYGQEVSTEYLGNNLLGNGYDYYRVQDVTFNPSQTYYTQWVFTPKDKASSGKWHVFGYNSNLELSQAISLGQYIYIDPSWTSNLNDELITYWNFNETSGDLIDVYGGVYNGTLTGAVQGATGIIGEAYDFTRTSSHHVDITSAISSCIDKNCSISFWVNQGSTSGDQFIWYLGDATDLQNMVSSDIVSNVIYGKFTDNAVSFQSAGQTITAGDWYHVVTVYNTTTMLLYVNGTLEATLAMTGTFSNSVNTAILGCRKGGGGGGDSDCFDGLLDEMAIWDRSIEASEVTQLYNSGSGITWVAEQSIITLDTPPDTSSVVSSTEYFSGTINAGSTLVNATTTIWFSNGTLFNSTLTEITGTSNSTNISISLSTISDYEWNIEACSTSSCFTRATNATFTYGFATNNATNFNNSVYETDLQYYEINLTLADTISTYSAELLFNGTSQGTSTATVSGDNVLFSNVIDVPLTNGTKNVQWQLQLDNYYTNTTANTQLVQNINFTECNLLGSSTVFLNATFKNETVSKEPVTAYISTGSFEYFLGSGTVNKTSSYTNATELNSYTFCGTPSSRDFSVNLNLVYDNSESDSRQWDPATQELSSTTLLKTLYLLPSSQSSSVSFIVKNLAEQALSGAIVTVTRDGYGTIAVGTTDDSGTVNFQLDSSATYTITAVKTNYPTGTLSVTPSEPTYTIILGESLSAPTDYRTGIEWEIQPTITYLYNNTNTIFNMTLTSDYWDLEEYGFIVQNSSGAVLGSASTTSESTLISDTVNTGNYSILLLNYYWLINSTYTNGSITYAVLTSGDTQYSINNFVSRFVTYTSSGLLGLETQDNFGRNLLIFIILFGIMAGMSYQYGLQSPEGLGAMLVFLIALFDVGFGLLDYQLGALTSNNSVVPHFITVITSLTYLSVVVYRRITQ